jgi:hypothetical protein
MPSSLSAREILDQSLLARESETDLLKSIKLGYEAFTLFVESGDVSGAVEAISNISISWRLLAQKTGKREYLYIAKAEIIASLSLLKKVPEPGSNTVALYNLAKMEEAMEEYGEAVINYRAAISSLVDQSAKRPAVFLDMQIHLAYSEYKNGDITARDRMLVSLTKLISTEEADADTKAVWISGGFMSLAEMLRDSDPAKSQEYLMKAKEYITDSPRLAARRAQWAALSKHLLP